MIIFQVMKMMKKGCTEM